MQRKIGFRYHERILQAVMNVVMIHLVNDGGHFSWIFMILWLVCSAKLMSCRVFWSTVRSFFKTENLARPFAGQHAHYYYLKGLLFCFWLILQPPGDRNHDVGLGQGWPAWWLRSSCILLVLPSQIFYTTHQWLPLASDNKFHSKWSKMLLLDSSRKINHLCNIFNDLLGQFALNWMKKN